MPDLVFTIKTPAELAGAQAAARAMEENIGKAKALGKEYGDLEQRLATTNQSIAAYKAANKDVGEETEKAGEKTRLFAGHSKELKKTIQELSREFPIAGLALKALANPIAFTLTVAIGMFVAIKRHTEEMNKSLDEMAASSARSLGNFAENFRKAKLEAVAANEDFVKGLAAIATAAGDVSKNADSAINSIHRLTAAQIELNNAAEAKATAQVNLDEAQGRITPGEGISRRAAIKNFYEEQKRKAQDSGEAGELAKRQKELNDLEAAAAAVARKIPSVDPKTQSAKVATGKQAVGNLDADTADIDKRIAVAEAKFEKANEFVAKMSTTWAKVTAPTGTLDKAKSDRDKAMEELDALNTQKAGIIKVKKQTEELIAALEAQSKAVAEGTAELKKLNEEINQKRRQAADLQATVELNKSVRAQTTKAGQETRDIEAQTEAQKEKVRADKEAEQQSRKEAQDADRAIPKTRRQGGKSFSAADTLPDVSEDFAAYHADNMRVLNDLKKVIADSRSQFRDNTNV